MPSVTPEEAKTSTASSVDSTLESKVVTTTLGTKVVTLMPPIVQSTLSENLTIEVSSSEEATDTTLNPTSTEESEEQITVGEEIDEFTQSSSEETEEAEEIEDGVTERMTTEYPETIEPFNVNFTEPQLGNDRINSSNNFINAC